MLSDTSGDTAAVLEGGAAVVVASLPPVRPTGAAGDVIGALPFGGEHDDGGSHTGPHISRSSLRKSWKYTASWCPSGW